MGAAWPDEHVDILKRDWGQLSSAKIAANLGYTRSAVLGKAYRIGLSQPLDNKRAKAGADGALVVRLNEVRSRKRVERSAPALREDGEITGLEPIAPIPHKDLASDLVPTEHSVVLLGLTNQTCRWPCGDPAAPGFFFCGVPEADMENRIPYCAAHARRAKAGPIGFTTGR